MRHWMPPDEKSGLIRAVRAARDTTDNRGSIQVALHYSPDIAVGEVLQVSVFVFESSAYTPVNFNWRRSSIRSSMAITFSAPMEERLSQTV
jgi:hypothetical protein